MAAGNNPPANSTRSAQSKWTTGTQDSSAERQPAAAVAAAAAVMSAEDIVVAQDIIGPIAAPSQGAVTDALASDAAVAARLRVAIAVRRLLRA